MCGILGFISDTTAALTDKRKFIEQGMIIGTLRGDDGAGMFAVPWKKREPDGSAYWVRLAADGYRLMATKEAQGIINPMADWRAIVGHNRSATQGGINEKATHPFQEGPITLVHNGTLDNTYGLKMSQSEAKAENDSHTICHNLAKHDAKETLEAIDGSFALAWHDARDDSVNLARNNQRPLFLAKFVSDDTVCFASEPDMINWLNRRNHIGLLDIVQMKAGVILKFLPKSGLKPEVIEFSLTSASGRWSKSHSRTGNDLYDDDYSIDRSVVETAPNVVRLPRGEHHAPSGPSRATVSQWKGAASKVVAPPKAAAALEALGIAPNQQLAFVPSEIYATRSVKNASMLTILGYLMQLDDDGNVSHRGGPPCLVGNILGTQFETNKHRVWSVRPVGVSHVLPGCPLIMAQHVSHIAPAGYTMFTPFNKHSPWDYSLPHRPSPQTVLGVSERLYPGPHGKDVNEEEWMRATSKGCISCGDAINIEEADTVEWVNDRRDPMCETCLEQETCIRGHMDAVLNEDC